MKQLTPTKYAILTLQTVSHTHGIPIRTFQSMLINYCLRQMENICYRVFGILIESCDRRRVMGPIVLTDSKYRVLDPIYIEN